MFKNSSLLRWVPRLLSIVAILFIGLLSLDTLDDTTSALDLFMLLLPALVLTSFLALAWKRERTGGIAFLAIGLGLAPFIYQLNHGRNHFSIGQSLLVVLIINIPIALVGALFLISYYSNNKERTSMLS